MIGPSIPAHLVKNQEQEPEQDDVNEDDLADEFMPALPPDLLPTTTTKRRTMGPQLPTGATTHEYDDDDDDTIGPALPSQYDIDQAALSSTVAAIEDRAKQKELAINKERSGEKKVERPEWMLAPPNVDYLKNASNGRSRTFNQRTVDAAKQDTSSWTDTPADKANKQQEQQSSSLRPDQRPTRAEMELRKKVDNHNKSERSMSLLELHRMNNKNKNKKRKDEDDPSKRPFDREKDLMGTRQMNKKQKAELLEKSNEWSDRFSSTRGSSFL
ncbi:hypothetical protein BC941DRAFT_437664 [Chlamydoabsidia padenii]|nr:hypothetical protein BC941DRAFT_437664 [Chlamydoabsidia padenii]